MLSGILPTFGLYDLENARNASAKDERSVALYGEITAITGMSLELERFLSNSLEI